VHTGVVVGKEITKRYYGTRFRAKSLVSESMLTWWQ
jgi:hypothetical protein